MLVDSEEEDEDLDDQGDSDGSANSPVYSTSSLLSYNQRRKGLKRSFLTSTPSSTTSYKRHFHEGRLLSDRLTLGEFSLDFLFLILNWDSRINRPTDRHAIILFSKIVSMFISFLHLLRKFIDFLDCCCCCWVGWLAGCLFLFGFIR